MSIQPAPLKSQRDSMYSSKEGISPLITPENLKNDVNLRKTVTIFKGSVQVSNDALTVKGHSPMNSPHINKSLKQPLYMNVGDHMILNQNTSFIGADKI